MGTPVKDRLIFRLINITSEIGGILSAVLLWVIAVIITYEVIVRYLFNAPTSWVQETSVYLWLGVGLLGAACVLRENGHFAITILVDRLSAKNRKRMQIFTHLVGFGYSLIFVYQGFLQAKLAYEFEDTSAGLMAMPLWIPWMTVPVGALMLALQFLNKIAEEISDSN